MCQYFSQTIVLMTFVDDKASGIKEGRKELKGKEIRENKKKDGGKEKK